jgi:hypothetical protein
MKENFSSSEPQGYIERSMTTFEGVELYDARIEVIHYDHSPRNPSLPVVEISNVAYHLTEQEAIRHLRSSGWGGKITKVR